MPMGYNPLLMGATMDRLYNQAGPYNYMPGGYINPMMFPMLSQSYMREMFNMQNPSMMFPQNTGSALGNAIGQLLGGAMPKQFPQYAPQQQQQPQQPQIDPVTQEVMRRVQQQVQGGKQNYAYALGNTVSQMMGDPQYSSNQDAMMQLDRFAARAKQLGFDPSQEERLAQQYGHTYLNLQGPNGKVMTLQANDPKIPGLLAAGYTQTAQRPQEPAGQMVHWEDKGLNYYGIRQPDGSIQTTAKSSNPMQFINNSGVTDLTPQQAQQAGLISSLSTAAASDKAKQVIADREVAVRNLDQQLQDVQQAVKNGAPTGDHIGALLEHADDLIGGAQQLAGDTDVGLLDPKSYNWHGLDSLIGNLQKGGQSAIKLHSMLLSAAYLMEQADSPQGMSQSGRKTIIEQNLDRLASDVDDPTAMYNTLDNIRQMYIRNLQNQATKYKAPLTWYGPGYKFDAQQGSPNGQKVLNYNPATGGFN